MNGLIRSGTILLFSSFVLQLTACSTTTTTTSTRSMMVSSSSTAMSRGSYASRLPQHIATREKTIVVDPNVHAWGAYGSDGNLIRAGVATAGANYCPDIKRSCRTSVGTFRIYSLGSAGCKSRKFPVGKGGAPMPYCMFFKGGMALHGSPYAVPANVSHGCVRMTVSDAAWVRFNFANVGTKVIVRSY